MDPDVLEVRFQTPDELRQEFEKNISNRGVFVATEVPYEVRQPITVEVILDYVDDAGRSDESEDSSTSRLALEGEIVHVIPPEMAGSGATPGVAIQFEAAASEICDRFEPLLGREATKPSKAKAEGADGAAGADGAERRSAKRGAVRVPIRVMPTTQPPFEATSRDLSATGVLISMKEEVLPVGEIVRVCLWHPSGDRSVEIDGQVVRQVPNKKGRIAAVAVGFDRNQAADPRVEEVIDALREAGHRSQLGGISGSLAELGLANMLQMFGASAPQGTLVIEYEGEQGWIAFAGGHLLAAELGKLTGEDALVGMLSWGGGHFRFEATADEKLMENRQPNPMEGALLRATCTLDERNRGGASGTDSGETDGGDIDLFGDAETVSLTANTTFEVDVEQEEVVRGQLDKAEEAILDLAKAGMSVERIGDVIPESAESIEASLGSLVEMGLLVPRTL